jgi:hypothetical protein
VERSEEGKTETPDSHPKPDARGKDTLSENKTTMMGTLFQSCTVVDSFV